MVMCYCACSESMPTYSNNTYGFTKILGEKILSNTCDVDDKWSAISLRYFNPAGSANCELLSEDLKNQQKSVSYY